MGIRGEDIDGDGQINFDEFVRASHNDPEAGMREQFDVFDVDGNGLISVAEFKHVMNNVMGQKLTDDEIVELIRGEDIDGDGQINYNEFVKARMSTMAPSVSSTDRPTSSPNE